MIGMGTSGPLYYPSCSSFQEAVVGGFMGGSAWTMARDIGGGFVNVTDRSFKSMTVPQLNQLSHEIERLLRELRGGATADEEQTELQARQRKIQRLNTALMVMRSHLQRRKR